MPARYPHCASPPPGSNAGKNGSSIGWARYRKKLPALKKCTARCARPPGRTWQGRQTASNTSTVNTPSQAMRSNPKAMGSSRQNPPYSSPRPSFTA